MISSQSIQESELERILATCSGSRVFAQTLKEIASDNDLLCALSRYIYFNSVFGSGVANLAGETAARQDLFRDSEEAIGILADRSIEVAADIFFAAIEEFGNLKTIRRSTHRSLAQATLKAAGLFFGHSAAALNDATSVNEPTLAAMRKVRKGYGINQAMSDYEIFRAIGFHLGSELLADSEFRILEDSLKANYPELVRHLKRTQVEINGSWHPAYLWIGVHTSVEADHFNAAVVGANCALRFYAGPESQSLIKTWIIEGFKEFAAMQAEFMQRLMEE